MSINSILEKRNKFQQAVETTSNFDFKFYGIEDETTRNELLQKEEIAKRNIMQIQRNTIELGKILYETQELLANHKNGAFNGWFLNLGLKKDFVYREIQRYKIFFLACIILTSRTFIFSSDVRSFFRLFSISSIFFEGSSASIISITCSSGISLLLIYFIVLMESSLIFSL